MASLLASFLSGLLLPQTIQRRLLSYVLRALLGKYVRGIDEIWTRESFSLQLLSGTISLRNIELQQERFKELLDALGLSALEVRQARVGSITLAIPWSGLVVKELSVKIEGLTLEAQLKQPVDKVQSSVIDGQPLEQAVASILRDNPEDTALLEQYLENTLAESKEDLPTETGLPLEALETALIGRLVDSILRSTRLEISRVRLNLHSLDYNKCYCVHLLYFSAVPLADVIRKWRFTLHGLDVKYEQSSEDSTPSSDSDSGSADDLTQSMYFSAEQSRSIYQSAMIETEPQSFSVFSALSDIEGDVLLSGLQNELSLHLGTCHFTFRDAILRDLFTLFQLGQPAAATQPSDAQPVKLKLSMEADKIDLRLPQRNSLYLTASKLSFKLHDSEGAAQFMLCGGMHDSECIQSSITAGYRSNRAEIESTGLSLHISPAFLTALAELKSLFTFSMPSTYGKSEQHHPLQLAFHTTSITAVYSLNASLAFQLYVTDCSVTSKIDDLVLISFQTLQSELKLSSHQLDFLILRAQAETPITVTVDLSSFETQYSRPISSLDRILIVHELEARHLVNHHFDHVSMKSLYRISSINIPKAKIILSPAHLNAFTQLSNFVGPARPMDQDRSNISASFKILMNSLDISFETWHGNVDQLELKGIVGSQNFASLGAHSITVTKSRKTVLKRLIDSQSLNLYGILVKSDRIVTRLHLNELLLKYDFSMLAHGLGNSSPSYSGTSSLKFALDNLLSIHDCAIQLSPLNSTTGAAVVVSHAGFSGNFRSLPDSGFAKLEVSVSKCFILVTKKDSDIRSQTSKDILRAFRKAGYAIILAITSEMTTIQLKMEQSQIYSHIHTHDLSVQMESCADSTETFFDIANSLGNTKEVSPAERKSVPISEKDLLRSLEDTIPKNISTDLSHSILVELVEKPIDKDFVESYYGGLEDKAKQDIEPADASTSYRNILTFVDDYFSDPLKDIDGPFADESCQSRWFLEKFHFVWNLYDGYDWPSTRDAIEETMLKVQQKAAEVWNRRNQFTRASQRWNQSVEEEVEEEDEEGEVGDVLFNSIYIGARPGQDEESLARAIDAKIGAKTETLSQAETFPGSPSRPRLSSRRRLKLNRSSEHKAQINVENIALDMKSYLPNARLVNSVRIKVGDFEITDNMPTSTWNKFVTRWVKQPLLAQGPMADIDMQTVQNGGGEVILTCVIAPLRLHVDQDTLDFITRFFTFNSKPVLANVSPDDAYIVYIQRADILPIGVKLDYKPKKVDYGGLRSGKTTELMNFFILEEAEMVLRRIVLHGISGFPRFFDMLNDIWMPDIRKTQLGNVLAGIAPVRSLVNMGSGMRDLFFLPVQEYQRDGKLLPSLRKGILSFAKSTGMEVIRMSSKVAVASHGILESAEDFLQPVPADDDGDESDTPIEVPQIISHYANQPVNLRQGIQRAYEDINRNVASTKEIILAIPAEVVEKGTARGAVETVIRAVPVAIIQPMKGASSAVSNTLLGLQNTLNPDHQRDIDNKYKRAR